MKNLRRQIEMTTTIVEKNEVSTSEYARERRLVTWAGWLSPLVAVATVPLIDRFLFWFLYLQPAPEVFDLSSAYRSKLAWAAASLLPGLLAVWWFGLKLQPWLDRSRLPWAAILTLLAIVVASAPFFNPKLRWLFVEWVLPRTDNPSFARNALFWEQRNFESEGASVAHRNVALVGSSQTYQGIDLPLLASSFSDDRFEKNCLAGLGPMQYPFLLERIRERHPDCVICQLSEFDFYREDSVPVNRLRWSSRFNAVFRLFDGLSPAQRWANRGELADLAFAAALPLWRQRDHVHRTVMGYWWQRSDPPEKSSAGEVVLADAPGLSEAIASLRANVGQKALVEVNFRSFATFASTLQGLGIELLVLEGHVHPQARSEYDQAGWQIQTRRRLHAMAAKYEFRFLDSTKQPMFSDVDFADAYHLNKRGRIKLTQFLATELVH